jgi:leucyl/phenylalanyl-tRNA--protein transferase
MNLANFKLDRFYTILSKIIFAPMLSPELLVQAYLSGSFPMADPVEDNQIFWHTPEQRGLTPFHHRFKVPKNLARL